LSPIRESRCENGSCLEHKYSQKRFMRTPPPTSVEQLEVENLMAATGELKKKKILKGTQITHVCI